VALPAQRDLERLVVVVAAHFALSHACLLSVAVIRTR
jgi:hypothetical protein